MPTTSRAVYAPANEALRQAIEWKRRGRVDYLVAGPVNALFADECDGILPGPEIDLVIAPSEWSGRSIATRRSSSRRVRVCPCGVDAETGSRRAGPNARAVVYWKSGDEAFCEAVETIVRACGLEPLRIRSRHGEHALFRPADYREALDDRVAGVFLSSFETQGIALAEAWSMDVPTVVWDPRGAAQWRGRSFKSQSSAPFLTTATGVAWRTIDELEPALRDALPIAGVPSARVGARPHDRRDLRARVVPDRPGRERGIGRMSAEKGFRRELGLLDASVVVAGGIIGVGIFANPSNVARVLETPSLILLAWTIGGAVALIGGFVWAELGSRFPDVGGQYVYLMRAYPPVVAFLYGIALLFIINGGSLAAVSMLFAAYVDRSFVPLGPAGIRLAAALALVALTGINALGVRAGKWTNNILMAAKVGGILLLVALAFRRGPSPASDFPRSPRPRPARGPGSC